jgi:hypothetical protein
MGGGGGATGGGDGGGGGATGGGGGATGGGGGATDGGMDGGHEHEGDFTLGRLAVGFADGGVVAIIDLDDRTVSTLAMSTKPRLYAGATSLAGLFYGIQGDTTEVVKSGITFHAHDEHFHISKSAPSLLPVTIAGSRVTHFTWSKPDGQDGWSVLFNDGDGSFDFVSEASLLRNGTPTRAMTGRAHHGVALLDADRLVATRPDPTQLPDGGFNILPNGVTYRTRAAPDTVLGTYADCPRLHGEHAEGGTVVFGCADGALVLKWNATAQRYDATKLSNPDGGVGRIGTVVGHENFPVFVGNFDQAPVNGLSIIDPASSTISVFPLTTRRLAFGVSMKGDRVMVLTMDGLLHRLELDSTRTTFVADGAPLQVIPPYTEYPNPPRPVMVMGWQHAYVSDPRDKVVKVVSLEGTMAIEHTFQFGEAPESMAITSVSPDWHHEH